MTSLTGDEPDLELGATGEGVLLLQVRLYALGIYRQIPDATYDSNTEQAVRDLQSQLGLDNDGEVHRETWEALVHQEQQYGIQYQYQSPYDALAQINYELEHPQDAGAGGGGQLSEDGQWRWNGSDWVAADGSQGGAGAGGGGAGGGGAGGELSPDGQWQWDGYQWQAAGGAAGGYGASEYGSGGGYGDASGGGELSPDGQWRWDGTNWQPATGGQQGGSEHVGMLSDDGQWRWDGYQWQAA